MGYQMGFLVFKTRYFVCDMTCTRNLFDFKFYIFFICADMLRYEIVYVGFVYELC